MRERQAFTVRRQFVAKAKKEIRAQAIRGRMALQGLYLPRAAGWVPGFVSELLAFPAGSHDDQVDPLGLIGQLLDTMINGEPISRCGASAADRWDRAFGRSDDVSWKTK